MPSDRHALYNHLAKCHMAICCVTHQRLFLSLRCGYLRYCIYPLPQIIYIKNNFYNFIFRTALFGRLTGIFCHQNPLANMIKYSHTVVKYRSCREILTEREVKIYVFTTQNRHYRIGPCRRSCRQQPAPAGHRRRALLCWRA